MSACTDESSGLDLKVTLVTINMVLPRVPKRLPHCDFGVTGCRGQSRRCGVEPSFPSHRSRRRTLGAPGLGNLEPGWGRIDEVAVVSVPPSRQAGGPPGR